MRRHREYTVYTIDANALMKVCRRVEREDRCFDFASAYDRSLVLEDKKKYTECALFSQIRKASHEMVGSDSPDTITRNLVYMHFADGISDPDNKEVEEDARILLQEGVRFKFKGDRYYSLFVPFDKSASMSRNNTISFINSELFDSVNRRLCLDINWTAHELVASKYYAYRGLYMTDGAPVPQSTLELNENTVIVIDNGNVPIKDAAIRIKYSDSDNPDAYDPKKPIRITHDRIKNLNVAEEEAGKDECDEKKKENDLRSEPYDGEGLICPAFSDVLNKKVIQDKQYKASSFQIRMPFTKGMLHTVDFHQFLKNEFPDENIDKLEIEDCFGFRRKIADVRIILTKSMFKCADWIKEKQEAGDIDFAECDNDPMRFYFQVFHKYEHQMYVVSSDANFKTDGYVKLNYQFLNTLNLDRDSFERLVKRHIDDTRSILSDPYRGRMALLQNDEKEDEMLAAFGESEVEGYRAWEYALKNNIAFMNDPAIKHRAEQARDGQITDIRKGRLIVPGTIKYLSGDLLYLLTYIAEKCNIKDTDRIKYLQDYRTLYRDRFYMPNHKTYGFREDNYYGVLRSPHLARNEQCALRPAMIRKYKQYFGHLNGVIMVSDKSSVPAALGGADFDGDTVKIINDEAINKAILDSVYEFTTETVETEEGTVEKQRFSRKLPVIKIGAPSASKRSVNDRISYEDLNAAFSSNVGRISNLALSIGKIEYSDSDTFDSVPANSAALCTIATGLEIDSVKTGIKPDISELEELVEGFGDKYLSIKSTFDNIARNKRDSEKIVHGRYNKEKQRYEAFFKYQGRESNTRVLFGIDEKNDFNIDLLPYYYVRELAEKGTAHLVTDKTKEYCNLPKYCYRFEKDGKCWKQASEDPRLNQLVIIMSAYQRLNRRVFFLSEIREKTKTDSLRGSMLTLLYTKYDKELDRLFESEAEIDDALETSYEVLYHYFKTSKDARTARQKMIDSDWQNARTSMDREKLLSTIIGDAELPVKVKELLCDTYCNGYQFLNFLLRDIDTFRTAEEQDEEKKKIDKGSAKNNDNDSDKDIYRKIYAKYRESSEYRNVWTKSVHELCRDEIYDIFDGDMESAIKCTLLMDGTHEEYVGDVYDRNHLFFWNVFNIEDISKVIYLEENGDVDA